MNETTLPPTLKNTMSAETKLWRGLPEAPQGYIGFGRMEELFARSRNTILQMVADGKLPKPLKDGQRNIWDETEVMKWLKNAKFTKRTEYFWATSSLRIPDRNPSKLALSNPTNRLSP